MSEPIFKVEGREPIVVDNRLTKAEIKQALDEIERLSLKKWPNADASVEGIRNTNYEWHRQKIPRQRFRTIFKIDRSLMKIVIIAILLRTQDTYDETVRKLYMEDKGET